MEHGIDNEVTSRPKKKKKNTSAYNIFCRSLELFWLGKSTQKKNKKLTALKQVERLNAWA